MLNNIYNQKITILNKLRKQDSATGLDVWYKTVVDGVAWYTDSARAAGGSSVFIGTYIKVLIPFNDKYMRYIDWKKAPNKDNYYTISTGDYIIKGEIDEEAITAQNIVSVMQKYGEDVCQVKHHNECHRRFGATVQLKIEGV